MTDPTFSPARILLVGDDVELAAMLSDYLVRDGFEVLAVPDGESGVAEALSGHFALAGLRRMSQTATGVSSSNPCAPKPWRVGLTPSHVIWGPLSSN